MNSTIVPCSSCGTKNRIPADKQHLKPKCGKCKTVINMKGYAVPVELNDDSFHEFIRNAALPVMVDLYSPTCGPCHSMFPIVDAMAADYAGKYIVAKLDTSLNQRTASFFNIRGVPTFLFFKSGSLYDQTAGAVPRNTLEEKLR